IRKRLPAKNVTTISAKITGEIRTEPARYLKERRRIAGTRRAIGSIVVSIPTRKFLVRVWKYINPDAIIGRHSSGVNCPIDRVESWTSPLSIMKWSAGNLLMPILFFQEIVSRLTLLY